MKIARILHESCPFPVVALERDGALYDVAELDARFATPRAPGGEAGSELGHVLQRAVALQLHHRARTALGEDPRDPHPRSSASRFMASL